MTIKELAAELHTPIKDINKWMKETNTSFYLIQSHEKDAGPQDLSSDGEQVIRMLHLEHTHPEYDQHIKNLTTVIFDQRKEITKLENIIRLLRADGKQSMDGGNDV